MRLALANACLTVNFQIGCQNASASIALTQLLRLPLELYSGKSLLMCFLYLLKIFSYMQTLVGVAGYSATVKGVATRKSLGTTGLYLSGIFFPLPFVVSLHCLKSIQLTLSILCYIYITKAPNLLMSSSGFPQ